MIIIQQFFYHDPWITTLTRKLVLSFNACTSISVQNEVQIKLITRNPLVCKLRRSDSSFKQMLWEMFAWYWSSSSGEDVCPDVQSLLCYHSIWPLFVHSQFLHQPIHFFGWSWPRHFCKIVNTFALYSKAIKSLRERLWPFF